MEHRAVATISLDNLLEAGTHFGHKASRWNPKMKPFIYGKRNGTHIIDLRETVRGLVRANHFLTRLTQKTGEVLFVGTKRSAKATVKAQAERAGQHYVVNRWLGGTLTNFQTIRSRLKRLEEIERLEKAGLQGVMTKKQISSLNREKKKIVRNLEGIRNMVRPPQAIIVVDPRKEHNAIFEARKLEIPIIGILDTDSDPTAVDIAIPANDDSSRAVQLIIESLTDSIVKGRARLGLVSEAQKKVALEKRAAFVAGGETEG